MVVDPLNLRTNIRLEGGALALDIRFENNTDEGILVLAYPGDLSPEGVVKGRAFIGFSTDGSRARVSLVPPRAPIGSNFGVAVRSLSQLIPAGEIFSMTITVDIPIRAWDPYLEALGDRGTPVPSQPELVTGVIFETEWHRASDSMMRSPGPGPDTWWSIGAPCELLRAELSLPHPVPAAQG
jgi:hypothetical protein